MDIPSELRGRVVASNGFDYTSTIFLLADDSNLDIDLQVYAPGMNADDFSKLCLVIRDRLDAALVGLNNEAIIEIHHGDEFNHFRIVINNPEYVGSESAVNIVLNAAKAIVQASEHTTYRRVFTLKRWECAVLVDWEEPFNPRRKEFKLTLPAEDTGLNGSQRDILLRRLEALCDRGVMADISTRDITDDSKGTVEVKLWSAETWALDPNTARAHIARAVFVLGTGVKLAGINNHPVVQLSHPFTPFVDDGSDVPERYNEY